MSFVMAFGPIFVISVFSPIIILFTKFIHFFILKRKGSKLKIYISMDDGQLYLRRIKQHRSYKSIIV